MKRGGAQSRVLPAVLGLAALAIVVAPAPAGYAAPAERLIRVEASSFQYAPADLTVNPGDRVTIELAATDVVHGLYLDGYDLNVTADPGQPVRLTFLADKPGAFRFRCSVTCGALHPFMLGKFNVGPNWLLWRAIGLAIVAAFAGVWLIRK
jgi:cytochrome c oxidase subunit 2